MLKLLGESCHNGPCPTLYRDTDTGQVTVQGYTTNLPGPIPHGEDVVAIPADAWTRLLTDLPIGMLLRALRGHLVPRRTRIRRAALATATR